MSRKISTNLKKKILKEVKKGKSKYQVAKEFGLRMDIVYRITKDLPSRPCGWLEVVNLILILQENEFIS